MIEGSSCNSVTSSCLWLVLSFLRFHPSLHLCARVTDSTIVICSMIASCISSNYTRIRIQLKQHEKDQYEFPWSNRLAYMKPAKCEDAEDTSQVVGLQIHAQIFVSIIMPSRFESTNRDTCMYDGNVSNQVPVNLHFAVDTSATAVSFGKHKASCTFIPQCAAAHVRPGRPT